MAAFHRFALRPLRRALPLAALTIAVLLGGCVAYPAYPGYSYGYGYAPGPYYGYPAGGVVVGGGWGWGGGWHDGWHGGWHH
jgi:hypothetical protein